MIWKRKDYSGEYTVFLIPCTVQPTQPWIDPGDKPLSCTAHAPEKYVLRGLLICFGSIVTILWILLHKKVKLQQPWTLLLSKRFLVPIAFQQTNRPVPVVYSLNTEFQLCNNEKVFMMDPATADVSMADMDYKGAFSMGKTALMLWNLKHTFPHLIQTDLLLPLQARPCMAGFCGTLSRTWMRATDCSWRRFTSAQAEMDTFPFLTPQGRCTMRGRSTAASSPTRTWSIASYCWYRCFLQSMLLPARTVITLYVLGFTLGAFLSGATVFESNAHKLANILPGLNDLEDWPDLLHQSHPREVFPDIPRLCFNKSARLCKLLLEPRITSQLRLRVTESSFCFDFKQ